MGLEQKVYNQCVIPAITYGCKTRQLTKLAKNLLRITQRTMEIAMLGVNMRDRHRSTLIRTNTRVIAIVQVVKKQKWI